MRARSAVAVVAAIMVVGLTACASSSGAAAPTDDQLRAAMLTTADLPPGYTAELSPKPAEPAPSVPARATPSPTVTDPCSIDDDEEALFQKHRDVPLVSVYRLRRSGVTRAYVLTQAVITGADARRFVALLREETKQCARTKVVPNDPLDTQYETSTLEPFPALGDEAVAVQFASEGAEPYAKPTRQVNAEAVAVRRGQVAMLLVFEHDDDAGAGNTASLPFVPLVRTAWERIDAVGATRATH